MLDYSLVNNDEDIPSEGLVLKKTRSKSKGGTLTTAIQPGQSVLPNARAALGGSEDLRQKASDLYAQGSDIYQQYLDKNEGAGENATLNALAAQFAGEGFQPLQSQFLKKAATAEDSQAKKAEFLMQQARAYTTLAENAETARERLQARQLAEDRAHEAKLLGLKLQSDMNDIRAQNMALARGQQVQAQNDRKDKQLSEGTSNLSKRADEYVNLVSGVRELNNKLAPYVTEGKSIPGVGYGSDISVLGIDVGGLASGEEGRANRSLVKNVANELLRAASGQAVTLNEYERQTLANMAAGRFSEKDFLNAYRNVILPKVNEAVSNLGGGFSQEVKDRYRQQGGKVDFSQPFTAPERQSKLPKATGASAAPAGVDPKVWSAMTPEEKALWK